MLIEPSARELGMLKLMVDFFAERPELTAKIDSYTTAHYALITTYSEYFDTPVEEAWKIFEDLQHKINEAEYLHVKLPAPLARLSPLSREELNMVRVLVDHFSEAPRMTSAGTLLLPRSEALVDAYQWFYGGNIEVAREILQDLVEKLQGALFVKIDTLTTVIAVPNPCEAALEQADTAVRVKKSSI